MPRIELTQKDWFVLKVILLFTIFAFGVWVGENYRPYTVASSVATFAEQEVTQERPASPTAPQRIFYTVREGDTIYSISRRYGVHPTVIKFANPDVIREKDLIHPGQRLVVPSH